MDASRTCRSVGDGVQAILEAAVYHAEHDDGVQFLGNHRLDGISAQSWRRQVVKHHGIGCLGRWRCDGVPEPAGDLGHAARAGKGSDQREAHGLEPVSLRISLTRTDDGSNWMPSRTGIAATSL